MSSESTAVVELKRGHADPATTREEFGARENTDLVETAATAVAAREQAATQARYIMAMRNPRDIDAFYQAITKECRRPTFAAKARYAKPIGKAFKDGRWVENKATGPSIRFIEAALRCFKNVYPEVTTVYDSQNMRICRVAVTDLESNLTYATEVQVTKTVERKGDKDGPPKGRIVLSERENSYGDKTYLVIATDDEVLVKQNALLSKAIRTNAQRLLPGDIVDECMDLVVKVQLDEAAKDPDAARRKVLDGFDKLGVSVSDLAAFLGHSTERINPKEMHDLQGAWTALKDGESSWNEIMEGRGVTGSPEAQAEVLAEKLAAAKNRITQPAEKGGVQGETAKPAQAAGTEREIPGATRRGEELSDDQNSELDRQIAAEEANDDRDEQAGTAARRPAMTMRRK